MKKHYIFFLLMLLASYSTTKAQNAINALNFDGTDDRVVCPISGVLNDLAANSFTFEAWVNPSASTTQRVFFSQSSSSNYSSILLSASNQVYFYANENGTTYSAGTSTGLSLNQWSHIAATWNTSSNTIDIYINGVLQTTANGGSTSTGTNGSFELGSRTGGGQYFNGSMDEVRIWSGVRSACDISQNMNSTLTGNELNLAVYYDFNSGSAGGNNTNTINLLDQSPNFMDGILTSFALTGSTSNWVTSGATITAASTVSYTATDALCGNVNGSITVNSAPGVAPLQYSIDGGVLYQSSNSFTGLTGGTYNLIVKDANNCTSPLTLVTINNAAGPSLYNIIWNNPTCGNNSGTIDIIAGGGAGDLEYSIDNGNTYYPSSSFGNLGAGNYYIFATDTNGCNVSGLVVLTNSDPVAIVNLLNTSATCGDSNGEIGIIAIGGTGTLQYSIDNGATFQTNYFFSNIPAGTYDLFVQDSLGCTASYPTGLSGSTPPTIDDVQATDAVCTNTNGTISVTASGGTGQLLYSIDYGTNYDTSGNFNGLEAGFYDVLVTDDYGCEVTQAVSVGGTNLVVSGSATTTDPLCGGTDGLVVITPANGTYPYEYAQGTGSTQFVADSTFANLAAGQYDFVIKDANGCMGTVNATLTTDTVDVGVTQVNATTLMANLTGATYQWLDCGNNYEPLATNANFLQYAATENGSYAVAITYNGCTDTSACFTIVVDGINNVDFAANMKLYPNPTSGLINIELGAYQESVTVKLANALGQTVAIQQFAQTDAITMQADVAPGLYVLMVENGLGQVAVFRLVKE